MLKTVMVLKYFCGNVIFFKDYLMNKINLKSLYCHFWSLFSACWTQTSEW